MEAAALAELRRFPVTVQSTYADLVSRLEADSVREAGGTPVRRQRRGRYFWYSVQRVGDRTLERYLGPDTPDVRALVVEARRVREDASARERARRPLVRMCREAGLPTPDVQTGKMLRTLAICGFFRLRGVLVGTHALRCYPALLGVDIPEAHGLTEDIDIAAFHSVSVALDDKADPPLVQAIRSIGNFSARPNLHDSPTAWRDPASGSELEILTPNQGGEREAPLELPAFGVHAKPLRFLDFLIHAPVRAAALYRSGVLVNVPQPARYAVHKLIVATRRDPSAQAKVRKDTDQAAALIRVLAEDRPDELEDAFAAAVERGPAWRRQLERGARRLPADARAALARLDV
jgi:hypothetical protein